MKQPRSCGTDILLKVRAIALLPLIALYEHSILHELAQPNQFFKELV